MPNKSLQDIPIKPNRVAQNRKDPHQGEGPFVQLVSKRQAEQVQLNGLTWNNDHQGIVDYEASTARYPKGDARAQGNRATIDGILGGNKIVNYPAWPAVKHGGNDSGQ
jgi:hypothetical protein